MFKDVKNPILPSNHHFAKVENPHELNLKAICVYVALGFFFGEDTFWLDEICLKSGHNYKLDEKGFVIESKSNFDWYYSPRRLSFDDALQEYENLLTLIMKEQVKDKPVILPLSGGLDSRSQAAILSKLENPVTSFSYSFKNGYPEHKIAKKIAEGCDFRFHAFVIKKGYLWSKIDELSSINNCYSEFTHPRQMAVLDDLRTFEGEYSLGHWGDVLFDRGVPEGTTESDIIPLLFKKVVKKEGLKLAEKLWKAWHIEGEFKEYLDSRFSDELSKINISNLSAKVRAFKTKLWAHRWTTTNLSVFKHTHPINLPYYDDRMINFICTTPEEYLADRKLQLAHLKKHKILSQITWHQQKPYNLNNYHYNKVPYNLPYRIIKKMQREINALRGKPMVLRNWELQFLGKGNEKHLETYLFDKSLTALIPESIIKEFYQAFRTIDTVHYAHPISMLLTLSVWNKKIVN